jgi:HSP20 family protein
VSTSRGGDQQRELRTTQERGGVRPSPSPRRPDLDQSNDVFSQLNSLAGGSPFAVMRRMMEDMDRLFSPFGASSATRGQQGQPRSGQRALQPLSRGLWAPQVEVFERGSNLVVRAELPGLSREDVDVEVDDDALVIRGERHNDVEEEHDGYYRSERSYGSFYRAIPLPEGVDASSCNANFKDGVLEVTLPKPAPQMSRAKKVNVR